MMRQHARMVALPRDAVACFAPAEMKLQPAMKSRPLHGGVEEVSEAE